MTTIDINFITDALLELCEPTHRLPSRPKLRTTRIEAVGEDRQIYQSLLRGRGHDSLLEAEVKAIYDMACLTPNQSKVLEMRMDGSTFEDIGRRRGHTKQGAQQIFLQAIKKIARALHVYPYTGLSDVYRIECRRGLRPSFGTIHR